MTKKTETTEQNDAQAIAALEATNRPVAGQASKAVDQALFSHQYQAGSPAADTNVLSNHPNRDLDNNIMAKIDSPENLKAKEDQIKALEDAAADAAGVEDFDCSKLDVSDIRYCQPGSDRHKAFQKKKK